MYFFQYCPMYLKNVCMKDFLPYLYKKIMKGGKNHLQFLLQKAVLVQNLFFNANVQSHSSLKQFEMDIFEFL